MGLLAVYFTASTAVFGVLIARNRRPGFDPALRAGLALGLVLTLVLSVGFAGSWPTAAAISSGRPSGCGRAVAMGWSREVGDLRVAHFLGTHAMHAVPLAGFVVGRMLPTRLAVAATWSFAGLWVVFCLATLAQALAGQPLLAG